MAIVCTARFIISLLITQKEKTINENEMDEYHKNYLRGAEWKIENKWQTITKTIGTVA